MLEFETLFPRSCGGMDRGEGGGGRFKGCWGGGEAHRQDEAMDGEDSYR